MGLNPKKRLKVERKDPNYPKGKIEGEVQRGSPLFRITGGGKSNWSSGERRGGNLE